MGIYTQESLETLRSRIDLPEVLNMHIDLKRFGSAFKALCPFHDEKTPSFVVQRGDSHYHCFGCGAHGDAIAFLMSHLKISFVDAVEMLAEKFGVRLDKVDQKDEVKGPSKSKLKEALNQAKRFYHFYLLYTDEGHNALSYLYKRGLDLDFIYRFEIGFAPKRGNLFAKFMKHLKYDEYIQQQVGLIQNSKRDFFYDRVMFPIKDAMGSTIGFSARKINEESLGPKYKNTPETPVFKKSQVLFGLSESRKRIAKERKAILVEGQIDALKLVQAGFDLTVAGQGTAFTQDHADILIKLGVNTIFIAFDGDEAGRQASIKVGDFFQKEGVEVFVLEFDSGQDPDEILNEKGPKAFSEYMQKAKDYLTFTVGEYSKTISIDSPSGKHQLVQILSKRIRTWNHPLVIHESLRKLAKLLEVPENLIEKENNPVKETRIRKQGTITKEVIDPNRILETDLLRWVFLFSSNKALQDLVAKHMVEEDFTVAICRQLFSLFIKNYKEEKPLDLLSLGMQMEDAESQLFLSEVLQKRVNSEKAEQGLVEVMQRIKERNWLSRRELIKMKIHSGRCSEEEVLELAKEFDVLKKSPPKIQVEEPAHDGT
ncbi:MAG: DNA primase [Chlamydiia bacterium]|nr:DNA primase [Chlamydiia bacterium]